MTNSETTFAKNDCFEWAKMFCALDIKAPRNKTITEIFGIENREVSASKALEFFFASDEYHGMGDLWLRSMLECLFMDDIPKA